MSRYRRNYVEGGTYFFTVVAYCRRQFLTTDLARDCLRSAIETVRQRRPFEIVAIVLLPDHVHAVWTLPPGDANYSTRWRRIKEEFTEMYLAKGGTELWQSRSRRRHGQRGIWHKRFWEHTIRDADDLERACDYIHWNPRKHELVSRVADWPHSSFHRFVNQGQYEVDWGGEDPTPGYDTPEWVLMNDDDVGWIQGA
jgi:putative transposase